mmetsp:Transcript_5359/g.11757  ORF Transcript_5359/g.11757 Transcript_5359/m.11757 type:complete len:330 (+) Transcript_5359:985-1974(+)
MKSQMPPPVSSLGLVSPCCCRCRLRRQHRPLGQAALLQRVDVTRGEHLEVLAHVGVQFQQGGWLHLQDGHLTCQLLDADVLPRLHTRAQQPPNLHGQQLAVRTQDHRLQVLRCQLTAQDVDWAQVLHKAQRHRHVRPPRGHEGHPPAPHLLHQAQEPDHVLVQGQEQVAPCGLDLQHRLHHSLGVYQQQVCLALKELLVLEGLPLHAEQVRSAVQAPAGRQRFGHKVLHQDLSLTAITPILNQGGGVHLKHLLQHWLQQPVPGLAPGSAAPLQQLLHGGLPAPLKLVAQLGLLLLRNQGVIQHTAHVEPVSLHADIHQLHQASVAWSGG